ncbi:MAG: hypothetical protein KDE20_02160 [Caldilineaceae bacterium]|nr:hypothetical protein [Caldilineaceae bacterium]
MTEFVGNQRGAREIVKLEPIAQYAERMGLRASLAVGIVLALLVLLFNLGRNPIPMLEDNRSFGLLALYFMAPAALIVAGIVFVLGIQAWNARVSADRQRGWKAAVVPVAFAYTVLIGLIGAVILQLAEPAFPGLALDRFQAALLVGLVSGALIYWLAIQTMEITSTNLLRLAIIVVAAGVYLAISRADDPKWWTISFSSVGTHSTFTSQIFNGTLIFGGLMVLVWRPYFASDLTLLMQHGLTTAAGAKWVNRGLIGLGITIALVGIFENQVNAVYDFIHNTAAPMMGVIVVIMAFTLRRLVPGFPNEVYLTSYILGGLLVLGVFFYAIGYFNIAGVTLYGGAIAFTWLTLFVGTVEQIAHELEPDAFPS